MINLMNKRTRAIAASAAVLVVGAVVLAFVVRGSTRPGLAATNAQPARVAVTAVARLEPSTEIIDIGAPTGSRIGRLMVKEGDMVPANAPLAYLDSHPEMEAARLQAWRLMQEAERRLASETAYGKANLAEIDARIRQAKEAPSQAITAQEAEVRRSKAELEKVQIDSSRDASLVQRGFISQAAFDTSSLSVKQSSERLASNAATLERLKEERGLNTLVLEAQLKSAEEAMRRAQVNAQVDSYRAAYKLAEERLERTIIRAPSPGRILRVMTRAGEVVGQHPICRLGDVSEMVAVAEIFETDLRLVQLDQVATITSKAFPDQKLSGKVYRIGTLVHRKDVLQIDPTADADARVVEARIRLDDPKLAARYNHLQVDVSIALSPKP
jgi:HlyD family secretion protein